MADDDGRPVDSTDPGDDGPELTTDERAAAILRDAEATAAAQGRAMVNEARAVRERMLDDLEQRRQTLLTELHRVREALDELAAGLAEPVGSSRTTEPSATRAPSAPSPHASRRRRGCGRRWRDPDCGKRHPAAAGCHRPGTRVTIRGGS